MDANSNLHLSAPQLVVAVLAIGLIVTHVCYTFLFSPLRHFPGPIAARFTDAYRALRTWKGRIDLDHLAWHRKYGSVVCIGPNTVMLNDPALIKVVFGTKEPWQKSDMYMPNVAVVDGKRVPNMFNTRDEAYHTRANRPVKPLYSLSRVQEVEPLLDESLAALVARLDARFADKGSSAVCMWDEWMAWWTWDAMFNLTFGEPMEFVEKEGDIVNFIAASAEGQSYYSAISQIPWLDNWLDKNPVIRIGPKPVVNGIGVTFMKLMEYQRKKAANKDSFPARSLRAQPFADKFLQLKETHSDKVDDNLVFHYSLFNILAGGDSTASVLCAAVYHLAKSPLRRARLQKELDDAGGVTSFRDATQLPYLTAVTREATRMIGGVNQTLERVVPASGFALPDGRVVPAGAKVGIDPSVIMKDECIFGGGEEQVMDVLEFRPERWLRSLREPEEAYEARSRRMVSTLEFAFGHGKRMCTGRFLVQLVLFKFLATLYSLYDIKLQSDDHEWKYRATWFVFQKDIPVLITRRRKN